jgi:PLU-1-like protein/PHD-finger/SPOC domain
MSDSLFTENDLPSSVRYNQERCQVCWKKESTSSLKSELKSNLYFCKACLLPVHKACYGLPVNSERMFFCDRCLELGPSTACHCEICRQTNGALKKADGKWLHVTCGISAGLVSDWITMSVDPFVPEADTFVCFVCKIDSYGTAQCGDCANRSHLLCTLRHSSISIYDYLTKKEFYCSVHIENHEKYCFCQRSYVEGEHFMIACDACDIWYHGDCVKVSAVLGENIEHYLCKFCNAWSVLKNKLENDDNPNKLSLELPQTFNNLKLKDWLILARALFQRVLICLERKCKVEDIVELQSMISVLPFKFPQESTISDKILLGYKLIEKDKEILLQIKETPDETLVPVLQNLLNEAKSLRILLPSSQKFSQYIENSQHLSQIKEILDNSKLFNLSQVKNVYDTMVKKFSKDLEYLQDLKQNISLCETWLLEVKDQLKNSQIKALGAKLSIDELKLLLLKAKNLPFSMQTEIRIVEDEIKSAEDWDRNYKQIPKPMHPSEAQMVLKEVETLAVETQCMRAAMSKLEEYNEWVQKTQSIISPSSNAVLPNMDQVKTHLALGEAEIEPFVDISEPKAQLKSKIQEAEAWRSSAINAIITKVSPQRLTSLVREAKLIICQFPELEVIERRANINKKISEIIHKKHKEEDLLNLMIEAKECNADEEFLQALQSRIQSVQELKTKVKETLEAVLSDPLQTYSKLSEELKNSKVELIDEKTQIEEKMKSLKWLIQAKETIQDLDEVQDEDYRKKKKGELEILKNLVTKGERISFRDPQAEEMLQNLTLRLWEIEYQRFQLCDEITLEQIKELESRCATLKTVPESLINFQNLLNDINQALDFYENLVGTDISKALQGDLIGLKKSIELYKEKLESYGMIFPEKYSKVINWDKWIDWCVSTEALLGCKPPIDKLYECNQDALSLSIPSNVQCLINLNKIILDYEQWLYKYTSYSSARKWFGSQIFEVQHYLKKAAERPKPSVKQLKELLDTALLLNIDCNVEINIMRNDLENLDKWVLRQQDYFRREKYEDILKKCKKSYESIIETDSYKEFISILKEYCFNIYVEYEDYGIKLCSYEWNLSGQRLLQLKGKISLEEWNDFFISIEYLHKNYLDQQTLDRLKVQNALRIQIEEELKKIKNLESIGQESKQMSIDVLEILSKQIAACKIVLSNEENYVKTTLEKCKALSDRFSELTSQRAFLQEFKNLQSEIFNLPVSIPETSARLKETIEKTATLSLRARILKEHAIKNKIEKSKVEQFLNDYQESDARLEDGENMLEELEYSKKVLEEAVNCVYDENSTLDQLNHVSGKLNNMKIYMGVEEKEVKIKLWKRKLQLSHNQKVNYSIILGWYNEGLQMKDYSMQEDLDRLELFVRKGEEFKTKLLACKSLDEIKTIQAETELLPFDLSHAVIEHKTRISLGSTTQEVKKVEVPTVGFIDGLENRHGSQKLIEAALTKDLTYQWAKHPQKAVKISSRIEEILYNNLQGNGYKKAVINMQKIISSLQEYGGFSEKLVKGEITPEELSLLNSNEVKVPKVIQRIFDGTPTVNITIHKSLLKSMDKVEPDLYKKKKVSKPEKIHPKKEISNLKNMIQSIKPTPIQIKPELKTQNQPIPTTGFSVAGLLNEVQAFHKKAEESKNLLKREEPKDFVLASEKHRNQSDKNLGNLNSADEWKELSKLRLERSGFSSTDPSFENKPEEIPVRRNRHDEYYEEGKFSSDEDENGGNDKDPGQEEYNLMELAQKNDFQRRKHRKKAKLYDPFSSSAPKNKALPGSLLKIWTGIMEYGKHSIKVDMYSLESIELFQKIPKLTGKLSVHGRTKQNELEVYISQNSSGLASRSIVTAWIEPLESKEKHFIELVNDLKEKSRAAVIRIDNTLTIYLSAITDSFISFLNSVRININQKVDKSISPYITENDKLGCLIFFKKSSGSSSSLIDPEIIAHIDPSRVPEQEEDDLPEKEEMSPITSGDDDDKNEKQDDLPKVLQEALTALSSGANYTEILSNLKQAMESLKSSSSSQDLGPNNNEINNLISVIRMQVEQEAQKQPPNSVQNVNQFLHQQFIQQRPNPYVYMPTNYMYPPQPIYPNPYFAQPPRPPQNPPAYRPPSPERKFEDPRRNTRY